MKRLNMTKEQFNKSRYFTKKYGNLEYVSESGNLYKTNKGKILKFKESENDAVEELCYAEGEKVIDACHTIEDFNDKIKELTGNYIFDPDEFFTTVHAEIGLFIDDH